MGRMVKRLRYTASGFWVKVRGWIEGQGAAACAARFSAVWLSMIWNSGSVQRSLAQLGLARRFGAVRNCAKCLRSLEYSP